MLVGKWISPQHLVISRKITSTKTRIACLTKIIFSKMKNTFSTTSTKQLFKKMRKRSWQREKKKKNSSLQTFKNNLEKEAWNWEMCVEMGIASFELLHINCMTMSRIIRKSEKKLKIQKKYSHTQFYHSTKILLQVHSMSLSDTLVMCILFIAWRVSKYRVISGPYFPALCKSPSSVQIQEKTRTRNNFVFGHFLHSGIHRVS